MNITFFGTGASECIPAFRCVCPVCLDARKKGGRAVRDNASAYIESDSGLRVLIDMPGTIRESLGNRDIDLVLFTHYHIDHVSGIFHLIESRGENGHKWEKPVDAYMPRDLFLDIQKGALFFGMAGPEKPDNGPYSLHVLEDLETFSRQADKGKLEIKALNTGHLGDGRECHGYLFTDGKKRYAYMTDASSELPPASLAALQEKPLDCLIYECTFDKCPGPQRTHSDIEGVLNLHSLLGPQRMLLTHISHRNLCHDELSALMARHGIEVAWDGLRIEV
jgi:phosphoribosyl 1,2-cyclic phosphate phosphodiesterase